MSATSTHPSGENEVTILARVLSNGQGPMSGQAARYIMSLGFSDGDKARMHDLAVRNQEDALSPAEKEELAGFAKAGSLLSILKSKARRALGVTAQAETISLAGLPGVE